MDGTEAAGPSCVSMGGYLTDSYYANLPHLRNGATKMVPHLWGCCIHVYIMYMIFILVHVSYTASAIKVITKVIFSFKGNESLPSLSGIPLCPLSCYGIVLLFIQDMLYLLRCKIEIKARISTT